MGTMQAYCGHLVSVEWMMDARSNVFCKDFTKEGYHAISYRTVCPGCYERYEREKLILNTEQEKRRWLKQRRGRNAKRKQRQKQLLEN